MPSEWLHTCSLLYIIFVIEFISQKKDLFASSIIVRQIADGLTQLMDIY